MIFKGALPFLSWRMLENPAEGLRHTALDDLESLTWVLFWIALGMESREGRHEDWHQTLSNKEQLWITGLSSSEYGILAPAKLSIFTKFKRDPKDSFQSECICALSGLFVELFKLHLRVQDVLDDILPPKKPEGIENAGILLEEATTTHFEEYFVILDRFLKGELPPVLHPSGSKDP